MKYFFRYLFTSLILHLCIGIVFDHFSTQVVPKKVIDSPVVFQIDFISKKEQPSQLEKVSPLPNSKESTKKILKQERLVKNQDIITETKSSVLKSQNNKAVMATYTQQLKLYLEENKVYPRIALRLRQKGIVTIKVLINQNGKFSNIQVVSQSPFSSLNQAAMNLLRSLGQFKPLPAHYQGQQEFIIPIAYRLNGTRI
jgi:TonB family protein